MSRRWVAYFFLGIGEDSSVRPVIGDELRLCYRGDMARHWEAVGIVVKVADSKCPILHSLHLIPLAHSDDFALEIKRPDAPTHCYEFSLEYIWKSTTFDRMQKALKKFAMDENALSSCIYHQILGHDIEPQLLKTPIPKKYLRKYQL